MNDVSGADGLACCYLCGSTDIVPLTEIGEFHIRRCLGCGLGRTEESPKASYDAAYLAEQWSGADPRPTQIEHAVRAEAQRVRKVQQSAAGKRLLEIGAGHGYFLEAAQRRGFEVSGIDVSSAAAEFARSHFNASVAVSSVDDAQIPQGSVDVVAAWHVLEHLVGPIAALRKAREWLTLYGIIAVEVPNYESYDARVRGSEWQGWQPKYHRWHFAPRTLSRMLTDAGFTVEEMWSPPSRIARERLRRIPVVGLFRRILWRFYTSTGIAAIARVTRRSQ
jgi:2-polyprenyl-3-methyl-5-hydroxy-6-metoxy-1,4-benzoquinol methylase